ncbi:MAG: hypothetical protein KJ015_39315 [Myxococcales bacterium]|nr:hypothetical protein [Myxococcales bacterium]
MQTHVNRFRGALIVFLLMALTNGVACRQSSGSSEPSPGATPVPAGSSQQLVDRGAQYARERLGFRSPELTYVLLACIDATGNLDPSLDACPGSMVATFAESGAPKGDLAFIVLGRKGMVGERAPYGSVISFDPLRCTPAAVLAIARARRISWDRATTTTLSYAPRSATTPAWILKQGDVNLLELTDAECVAAAH